MSQTPAHNPDASPDSGLAKRTSFAKSPALAPPVSPPANPYRQGQIRSLRHRAPLLWVLLPFALGIIATKIFLFDQNINHFCWWAFGIAVPLCVFGTACILSKNFPYAGMAALVVALVIAGASCLGIQRARPARWDALPPREGFVTLRVTNVFPESPASASASGAQTAKRNKPPPARVCGLARIIEADVNLADAIGQPVYFSLNISNATTAAGRVSEPVLRTSEFKASGVLQPISRAVAADSAEGKLAAIGMNFIFSNGYVVAETKSPSAMAKFFESMRIRFVDILSKGIENSPRQIALLRGMVLGQKQEIDDEQTSIFLGSGTMHLFAISGMHIAVIALAIYFLLLLLRLPHWPRLAASLVILWLYVQITGASPSAVRAYVMVAVVQIAFSLRQPANAIASLTFAALITLIVVPMQLFSASFQMSYGIVAAILLCGLPLGECWNNRWQLFRDIPKVALTRAQRFMAVAWRYFLGVLAISVAASLVSMICGTIYFQLFTPGALLINMLLIPAASLVILSGVLSLLFGLAGLTVINVLFNHASALLLVCMEKLLGVIVSVPGANVPAQFDPEWRGFFGLGLLLAAMLYGYSQKWILKRGGFCLPVAIALLTLALFAQFG